MKLYLDVCCLNRPFDDQSQSRIRIESEAIILILDLIAKGDHTWVSSEAIEDEVLRNPDVEHRLRILALLAQTHERILIDETCLIRARALVEEGFGAMDALHVSTAESAGCDILLTTDDALLRKARATKQPLTVRVENPARWISEVIGS